MLLHDALDVLATNADNTLMVLVRNVEGNGCRHLLLHQSQTFLHGGVVVCQDVDVEVVLAEVVENDLDIAVAHDLVDLAVLLAAHKFLVFIGELDLDTNLVLDCSHELDFRQNLESLLDGFIRPSKRKGNLVEGDIGIGVGANITEQGTDLLRAGEQTKIRLVDPPGCRVKLASLKKSLVVRSSTDAYNRGKSYQRHELADGSLNMKVLGALETNRALPGSKRREHDEDTVGLHDLAHLVHPTQQNAVNLGHGNRNILDEESDGGQNLVDASLGLRNGLGGLASDEDLIRVTAQSTRRAVSIGV